MSLTTTATLLRVTEDDRVGGEQERAETYIVPRRDGGGPTLVSADPLCVRTLTPVWQVRLGNVFETETVAGRAVAQEVSRSVFRAAYRVVDEDSQPPLAGGAA